MSDVNTRPNFFAPFPTGTRVTLKSYAGHNPDHMKMDIYAAGWPGVVASAPGLIHEHFEPGGIEIRHFIPGTRILGNWYTTYMHMSSRAPVGTTVDQGEWVGTAGSVGTGVQHLHHEQLQDRSGDGDADTGNMVYPAFVEYNDNKPFSMPLGEPGITFVSQNKHGAPKPVTPSTNPKPSGKLYQGQSVPPIIGKGTGRYFGLITGPSNSIGGFNPSEKPFVKMLQQRLIVCGFVPGVTNPAGGWADGVFEKPTAEAVTRFQKKHLPNTKYFGQVWYDDWVKLFNL
jgi:hypothetical protein